MIKSKKVYVFVRFITYSLFSVRLLTLYNKEEEESAVGTEGNQEIAILAKQAVRCENIDLQVLVSKN